MKNISPVTRRRLDIQGFTDDDENLLKQTANWLRFPFALCTILAALGTVLASPAFLAFRHRNNIRINNLSEST